MEDQPNTKAAPRDGPHQPAPQQHQENDFGHPAEALRHGDEPTVEPDTSAEQTQRERSLGRIAVYAASLLDYNYGVLHGAWLDADVEADELQAGIDTMLTSSPTARETGEVAEEWAIHDYEGFGPATIGEYAAPEMVARLARRIREHGLAYAAWVNLIAEHFDDSNWSIDSFEDAYLGEWKSLAEYAEHLLDDLGLDDTLDRVVSAGLRPYVKIDAEGFARDLELSGDVTAVDATGGGVWVFSQ